MAHVDKRSQNRPRARHVVMADFGRQLCIDLFDCHADLYCSCVTAFGQAHRHPTPIIGVGGSFDVAAGDQSIEPAWI